MASLRAITARPLHQADTAQRISVARNLSDDLLVSLYGFVVAFEFAQQDRDLIVVAGIRGTDLLCRREVVQGRLPIATLARCPTARSLANCFDRSSNVDIEATNLACAAAVASDTNRRILGNPIVSRNPGQRYRGDSGGVIV